MKKNKLLYYLLPVVGILLLALLAPHIIWFDPYQQNLNQALKAPDAINWLGTDRYGRDILTRILMGAQSTVLTAATLLLCISIGGTLLGVVSGYYSRLMDSMLMRVTDVFLAFPEMIFAVAVAAVFGGGMLNAALALALVAWPKYARLARELTMGICHQPYIAVARMNKTSIPTIIMRHIFPNIAGPLIVTAALDMGSIIMQLAGLSFLGLGAMPPAAEWGAMINAGRSMIQTAPWMVIAPGCAIFITVVCFNLLGDYLRDYLDPQQNEG